MIYFCILSFCKYKLCLLLMPCFYVTLTYNIIKIYFYEMMLFKGLAYAIIYYNVSRSLLYRQF